MSSPALEAIDGLVVRVEECPVYRLQLCHLLQRVVGLREPLRRLLRNGGAEQAAAAVLGAAGLASAVLDRLAAAEPAQRWLEARQLTGQLAEAHRRLDALLQGGALGQALAAAHEPDELDAACLQDLEAELALAEETGAGAGAGQAAPLRVLLEETRARLAAAASKVGGEDPRLAGLQLAEPRELNPQPTDRAAVLSPERFLGEGGFGVIYRATYRGGAEVAVKVLHRVRLSEQARRQLQREARAMALLRSPFVVTLYAACFQGEALFLVMELCRGGSLRALLDGGGGGGAELSWPVRLRFCLQVACGVRELHRVGLLHRDLKAANVLLDTAEGRALKLIDFGLARCKDEAATQSSLRAGGGAAAGTVAWMAPELLSGESGATESSDVYALGVVLYEVASRRAPFEGHPAARVGTWVVQGRRPDLAQIRAGCPSELRALMQECWAQEAGQRPLLEDVVERLQRLHEQTGAEGQRPLGQAGLAAAAAAPAAGAAPAADADESVRGIIARHGLRLFAEREPRSQQYRDQVVIGAARGGRLSLAVCHLCSWLPATKVDPEAAFAIFREEAARGEAWAEFCAGRCYAYGTGVAKDEREAVRLYRLAADQGNAAAQCNLGLLNEHGKGGLAKDEREAARLYRLAAEQGNATAQYNLGVCYEHGDCGVAKDEREAARLYRLAANQGNDYSQCALGRFYNFGMGGLAKDEREAARLFRLAADQGDAAAQYNLGLMYANGLGGLAKDEPEALRLIRLAADQGLSEAQQYLESRAPK